MLLLLFAIGIVIVLSLNIAFGVSFIADFGLGNFLLALVIVFSVIIDSIQFNSIQFNPQQNQQNQRISAHVQCMCRVFLVLIIISTDGKESTFSYLSCFLQQLRKKLEVYSGGADDED